MEQFTKNGSPEKKITEQLANSTAKSTIAAMVFEHLGTFSENVEVTPYSCTCKSFPTTNVITGGPSKLTMGIVKRNFEELMSVNHMALPNTQTGGRPPIAFLDSDLSEGAPNSTIPLHIQAYMANVDVRRILVALAHPAPSCIIVYSKSINLLRKTYPPTSGLNSMASMGRQQNHGATYKCW